MRGRLAGLGVLFGLGVVGVWLFMREPALPSAESGQRAESPHALAFGVAPARDDARKQRASRSDQANAEARAKRDALREQIVHALERTPRVEAPADSTAASRSQPSANPPKLTNRLGEQRQALVDALDGDFMPLAMECIEQAEEQNPSLQGMVGIAIEIVADEELGGVIDRADPAPSYKVPDGDLIECIRQSALSVTLPKGLITGRERFVVTLRVGGGTDADRPG